MRFVCFVFYFNSLSLSLSQTAVSRISELPEILDQISHAMEEANEDPFSSTFEALRVMHSTISKFTPQSLKVSFICERKYINFMRE